MKKRRTPTRRIFLICISTLVALFIYTADKGPFHAAPPKQDVATPSQPQSQSSSEIYTVKRVVDGDTFVLSNGEKIRLTGIDTPESGNNAKTRRDSERSGEDLRAITKKGKEAARFVRELAEGKKIRVEYDVQKRDRYGRLLVYAYDIETLKTQPTTRPMEDGIVINGDREIFLNGSIIRSGYATPLTIPPNVKHAELFKKLYAEARSEERGLWAPQATP